MSLIMVCSKAVTMATNIHTALILQQYRHALCWGHSSCMGEPKVCHTADNIVLGSILFFLNHVAQCMGLV